MQNSELCVSAKALELDGAAPVVGDEVEVTIKGKVTRAEGGEIYIKPESANGQPLADMGAEPGADDPSEQQLREMAGAADGEEGE